MIVSKHTVRSKRIEKIAKGVIWAFVIFTIAVLAWIILYVMVRGFYSQRDEYSSFPVITEEVIETSAYPGEGMIFFTHRRVRVKEISIEELRELYLKRRNHWGSVTGQNLRARPFIYGLRRIVDEAADQLLLAGEDEYNRYTETVRSPEQMVEMVEKTPGGVGFIRAKERDLLEGRKVKILPIERIAFPINPGVREIKNNIQVGDLTLKQMQEIFRGEITNWQQVGGIDLPVVPVHISTDNEVYGELTGQILSEDEAVTATALQAAGVPELLELLEKTPGAVGACYYHDLENVDDQPMLQIRTTRRSANLDIHYIIEAPAESGAWGGISTIIINTFFLILFTLVFSTPIGVFAAIYLVEYAKQNRFIRILRMGTETLAGIPSIVFGLFGFLFFVDLLNLGIGFISAVLTVTMMVLPTIIRTSEEALKAVPRSYREGSLALGATRLQTIFKVVLPAASPGILSGIILALGRTVGETAVLIYTLGSNYELVRGPSSSARVLSLHLYNMFAEAISFERCFATGTILIFIILIVNLTTTKLIGNLNKKAGRKN